MKLKEIRKDIYDVSASLDEEFGEIGTPEREKAVKRAWREYNVQILLDTHKKIRLKRK